MKTMTCSMMGGPCTAEMQAEGAEQMIAMGMEHVQTAHPEMMGKMDAMTEEEKKAWHDDFMHKWEMTAEVE